MSANIDQTKGKSAFVAFQEPAWHGLGKIFTEDIKIENLQNEAGLDFEVVKSPNVHRIVKPTGEQIEVVSDSSFFTYRTDNDIVLGSRLGSEYTVYQNEKLIEIVDDIMKFKKLKIETAGSIDEGRRVFITMKLQQPIKVGDKDYVDSYFLVTNGHDGSLSITLLPTNVRVVCANTLGAALYESKKGKKGFRIRHSENADIRVKEVLESLALIEQNQKRNSALYNAMREMEISKQDFYNYIGNVFFTEDEIKEFQKGNRDAVSTRKANVAKEVVDYAFAGVGQDMALKAGGKLNSWFSFNAVTGYFTSKKYKNKDDRFNNLIFGEIATKIDKACDLAANPHKIKTLRAVNPSNLN